MMLVRTGLLILGVCLLISSPVVSQEVSQPELPPDITILKIKWETWDFIFTDAANNTELKRQSLANRQKIDVNQKKTLRFTTQAAPPKIVSVGGLEKDKRSPFTQSASIRCLLFADGSVWEQPKLKGACGELQQWIARRKKVRPGVEDLPLKN